MNAISDHLYAIQITFEKLFQGKYWTYLIPGVIICLIYYGSVSLFSGFAQRVSTVAELPVIGSYVQKGIDGTIGLMDWFFYQFYQFVVLTLLSPVNCLLSEKVDNDVTGANFSGGIVRILSDLIRAVFIVIVALILNLFFMAIWWVFAWITGFHLLDEIMYFLIGSFFIGFSFYDFSLERYDVGTFGSWNYGFERIGYMLATGGLFSAIYLIPVVGVVIAPFLVTIISTIVFLKVRGIKPSNKNVPHE